MNRRTQLLLSTANQLPKSDKTATRPQTDTSVNQGQEEAKDLDKQFKLQMQIEEQEYFAQRQASVAKNLIVEQGPTAAVLEAQSKSGFERKSLSHCQFYTELTKSHTNQALQELLRSVPPAETLDTKTSVLLKSKALQQLVVQESSNSCKDIAGSSMHQDASAVLIALYGVSDEKREFLSDYLSHFVDLFVNHDKVQLKRRGMFRSKASMTYMTYTLCMLMQQVPDNDLFTQLAQLLTSKAERQPEAILLLQLLCSELAQLISQSHIEIPCSLMLSKVLALHAISLLQETEDQPSQPLQVLMVEILGYFLSGTQASLLKLKSISQQQDCYCAVNHEQKSQNQCKKCGREMHLSCTNSAILCTTCQKTDFYTNLTEFYEQYQSSYIDFSTCVNWIEYKTDKNPKLATQKVRGKSWLSRDLMCTGYARSLLLSSGTQDQSDLKLAITQTLILTCYESPTTQIRQKSLKALRVIQPLTPQLTQLLKLRLRDQSCLTRELCLDMLGDTDILIVVEMAADRSITVRQKVVQILSRCLEQGGETSANVLLVLSRQNDHTLRVKVIKCLALVLQKRSVKSVKSVLQLLKEINSKQLWTEVFDSTKQGQSVLASQGPQLCYEALHDLEVLDILVSSHPQGLDPTYLPVLSEQLNTTSVKDQKLVACILHLVMHYQQDVMFGDELPNSTVSEMIQECQRGFVQCSLQNIDCLVKLMCQLNQLQLLQLSLKAAELLKSIHTSDSVKGRAILLLAYAVYHLPVEGLENFSANTKVDVVARARDFISMILVNQETSAVLLDIALEGISVVWLKYPQMIGKDSQKTRQIFSTIVEALSNDLVHSKTKAQILQTLTKFLKENSQDLIDGLAEQLTTLTTQLCSVQDVTLRQAGYSLLHTLFEQGLAPTSQVVPIAVLGCTVDPSSSVRHISIQLLKQLCHQKLQHVTVYLSNALTLVDDCYRQLSLISLDASKFDGSQQTEAVYEDRGLMDLLMRVVGEESHALVKDFVTKMVKVGEKVPLEQTLMYVQILITVVDSDKDTAHLVLTIVQTQEQLTYQQLKTSVNSTDQQVNTELYNRALKLYGLKLCQKLMTKQMKPTWRQVMKQLQKVQDVSDDLTGTTLLQALKQEVKAKDTQLKAKFKKQFDKIMVTDQHPVISTGRKKRLVSSHSDSYDDDDSPKALGLKKRRFEKRPC